MGALLCSSAQALGVNWRGLFVEVSVDEAGGTPSGRVHLGARQPAEWRRTWISNRGEPTPMMTFHGPTGLSDRKEAGGFQDNQATTKVFRGVLRAGQEAGGIEANWARRTREGQAVIRDRRRRAQSGHR